MRFTVTAVVALMAVLCAQGFSQEDGNDSSTEDRCAELAIKKLELAKKVGSDENVDMESLSSDELLIYTGLLKKRIKKLNSDVEYYRTLAQGSVTERSQLLTQVEPSLAFTEVADDRLNEVFRHLNKVNIDTQHIHHSEGLMEFTLGGYRNDSESQNVDVSYKLGHFSRAVRPNFTVYFLNKYGFATGVLSENWSIKQIQSGESRTERKTIAMRFGPPVYYFVSPIKIDPKN